MLVRDVGNNVDTLERRSLEELEMTQHVSTSPESPQAEWLDGSMGT